MIGIFDSGVGGLSIYREIKTLIPETHYIYFQIMPIFLMEKRVKRKLKLMHIV